MKALELANLVVTDTGARGADIATLEASRVADRSTLGRLLQGQRCSHLILVRGRLHELFVVLLGKSGCVSDCGVRRATQGPHPRLCRVVVGHGRRGNVRCFVEEHESLVRRVSCRRALGGLDGHWAVASRVQVGMLLGPLVQSRLRRRTLLPLQRYAIARRRCGAMRLRGGEEGAWLRSEPALGDLAGADQVLLEVICWTGRAVSILRQLARIILRGVPGRPLKNLTAHVRARQVSNGPLPLMAGGRLLLTDISDRLSQHRRRMHGRVVAVVVERCVVRCHRQQVGL